MMNAIGNKIVGDVNRRIKEVHESSKVLSTGKRINSAADNGATSAIVKRFNSDLISLRQANRNIQDGMRAVTTADDGINEVTKHLTEMRKLAVQASNGTYSDADRTLMYTEFVRHQESIQDLSLNVQHNGDRPLLNPGWVQLAFGIDVSGSMSSEVQNLESAINGGTSSLSALLDNNDVFTQFSLTAVGDRVDPTDSAETLAALGASNFSEELDNLENIVMGQAEDPYSAIMSMLGLVGNDDVGFVLQADQKHIVYITDTSQEVNLNGINKQDVTDALVAAGVTFHIIRRNASNVRAAFDTISEETGGLIRDLNPDGSNISDVLDEINQAILADVDNKRPTIIQAEEHAGSSFQIEADFPVNATLNALGLQFSSVSLETREGALETLDVLDSALAYIDTRRSFLGSTFQRLESALDENLGYFETLTSATSKMEDADIPTAVNASTVSTFMANNSTEILRKSFNLNMAYLESLLKS